jgi:hypothetical protein
MELEEDDDLAEMWEEWEDELEDEEFEEGTAFARVYSPFGTNAKHKTDR